MKSAPEAREVEDPAVLRVPEARSVEPPRVVHEPHRADLQGHLEGAPHEHDLLRRTAVGGTADYCHRSR